MRVTPTSRAGLTSNPTRNGFTTLLLTALLLVPLTTALGGRKVAIVVDNSLSNESTDPTGLRVDAARSINEMLISAAEAGGDKEADEVALVKFSGEGSLVYPLGDPGTAVGFEEFNITEWGTWVGDGAKLGIDEVSSKGKVPTMNRTALVVLTDGQDEADGGIVLSEQLIRAEEMGIRVSFGFLSPIVDRTSAVTSTVQPELLASVLRTGGIYGTINSAAAQKNFVQLVFLNGLTDIDGSRTAQTHPILPGLTVAGILPEEGQSEIYTYGAIPGEALNFTVSIFDTMSQLQVALLNLDKKSKLDVQVATNGMLPAQISYTAQEEARLAIVLTTLPGLDGSGDFDEFGTTPGTYELTMGSSDPFRVFTTGVAGAVKGPSNGGLGVGTLLASVVFFVGLNMF